MPNSRSRRRRRLKFAILAPVAQAPAGRVCVVAAAFVPSEDWQLACAAGDRVTVTTEDDGLGWVEVVREADGAKGLVPLSYLTAE